MLENGFIKLYRSFAKWEWYTDANTMRLFLHLLLTVNYEPNKWRGITIERGQTISSYGILASELKISTQSVRTAIKHLILTGELTHEPHSQYGVFTINNYDKYQTLTHTATDNQQATNTQPTDDQHTTNNNERKIIKNNKDNKEKESKENNNIKPLSVSPTEESETFQTFSSSLQTVVSEWIEYKKERRETYKPMGLKKLLTEIKNKSIEIGEQKAITAIDASMAKNYKGIIWDLANKPYQKTLDDGLTGIEKLRRQEEVQKENVFDFFDGVFTEVN